MQPLQVRVNLGAMTVKGYSPKILHYWSLTIWLFSVISRTNIGGGLFCNLSRLGLYNKKVKLTTVVEGDPKAPFSIATTLKCRGALLLSLNCSTLPLIRTLYCWVLSKEVSSTIFKVLGMTRPGIESWSTGPLANTLPTWPTNRSLLI